VQRQQHVSLVRPLYDGLRAAWWRAVNYSPHESSACRHDIGSPRSTVTVRGFELMKNMPGARCRLHLPGSTIGCLLWLALRSPKLPHKVMTRALRPAIRLKLAPLRCLRYSHTRIAFCAIVLQPWARAGIESRSENASRPCYRFFLRVGLPVAS
jgi:hypothetical protein